MHTQAHTNDYSSDAGGANLKEAAPAAAPRASAPARPADGSAESLLGLLARAVQQFHTYPATSTMCVNAVEACQRALVQRETSAPFAFRVAPREVIIDDAPIGRGSIVEQELARRLHTAAIAEVSIDRAVTARELTRFCEDLIAASGRRRSDVDLIERLAEHGVERITLRAAYRPEVLEVGAPPAASVDLVEHERRRREAHLDATAPVSHLYPPDKGWVRLDPSAQLDQVSLVDLALLTPDPSSLAAMLLRLTDDDGIATDAHEALTQKFSDLAMLFAALEPNLARVMFARLARAVLDLDPAHRQELLRRTILPALLDGKIEGNVLRDFPDLDLADSLCLLLDLETAAPEVVSAALAKLDLPAERQAAVLPLVERELKTRGRRDDRDTSVHAHARRLVQIDQTKTRNLAEFAAFDLGIGPATATALEQIGPAIMASDTLRDRLDCLWRLTRLEANPEGVQRLLELSAPLIADAESGGRWPVLVDWLSQCRDLAAAVGDTRPDVAQILEGWLAAFATPARTAQFVRLMAGTPDDRAIAARLVDAIGVHLARPLLAVAIDRSAEADARAAVQALVERAPLYAAPLSNVDASEPGVSRVIARVLGHAGPGHEAPLGQMLLSADEQTVREALRGLARIGTPAAAALVTAQIEHGRGWIRTAAEQTLWRFPEPEPDRRSRELLTRREFIVRRPDSALRLLDRLAQAGAAGLEAIVQPLVSLRYRIWNPPLARVGRRARAILTS